MSFNDNNFEFLINKFQRDGFCHLKILDKAESKKLSSIIDKKYELAKKKQKYIPTGINNFEELWYLISDKRILSLVEKILKDKFYYLYHSAIMKTTEDEHYQHHRDNPNRKFGKGSDWNEKEKKFKILRLGIYLDDYEETNFKLNLIPKSHKNNFSWREILRYFHKKLRRGGIKNKLINFLPKIFGEEIKTTSGTCIIFDPRVYHSPSPHKNSRRAIFLAYGCDNFHSKNYVNYFIKERKEDHPGLEYETIKSQIKFQDFLKSKKLFFSIN